MLVLAALACVAQGPTQQLFSLLYQFKSGRDGSSPYSSLILDAQGNLYGTTIIDGAYSYGTVFKISPQGKETVLHSFRGTGGDGANPVAPLIMDAAGNLYGTTEYGGLSVVWPGWLRNRLQDRSSGQRDCPVSLHGNP